MRCAASEVAKYCSLNDVSPNISEKVLMNVVVATMAISAPIAFRLLLKGKQAWSNKQEHVDHILHAMIGNVLKRRASGLQTTGSAGGRRLRESDCHNYGSQSQDDKEERCQRSSAIEAAPRGLETADA
jgi:hypothetical protein